MKKPREIFTADEETTVVVAGEEQPLVAPRFDDEETLVARPVVPLGEAEAESPTASAAAPSGFTYARGRRLLPQRRTLLALVLGSVLIGGVLGGAGLYLYQRQSGDARTPPDAPTAVTTSQPENPNTTPNEASQPAPTSEAVTLTPDAPPASAATDTPPAAETSASNAPADEARADADGTGAAHAREAESVPVAADHTGTTAVGVQKRGKKGERDEESERPTRRANRADSGAPIARADADAREARRVDTIFYRPRRAPARDRARRQTAGDADRLRRIFEGNPER